MGTILNPCSDRVEAETAKIESVKFDAIGGRVVGVILALYGLAVVFEIVRSYILVN